MSDHRYIRFDVADPSMGRGAPAARSGGARGPPPPRWSLRRIDRDAALAAASGKAWEGPSPTGPSHIETEALWFREAMTQICDSCMPRARAPPRPAGVYWWSDELAALRAVKIRRRRKLTNCLRRKSHTEEEAAVLRAAFREVQRALRHEVARAKTRAWEELLGEIDGDPWGRPYRIVRHRLRSWAPPVTETLPPETLEEVMEGLFPGAAGSVRYTLPQRGAPNLEDAREVSEEELSAAVERLRRKRTAPGPDGIPGLAWVLALKVLGDRFRQLMSSCLAEGRFPSIWKEAGLVLLRKPDRPAGSPSAYRPICLLDEAGKLFERVIAARLVRHLGSVGPNLAECQYGFREGRSTIDAIQRVRTLSDDATSRGGVALAVSLDIANAFNTLPWECIMEALRYHGVPVYLQEVIHDYLHGRHIRYTGRYATLHRREIHCGVPQGSVLGPLLWNLGYNRVLRGALLLGLDVVCYADDTLVIARGEDSRQASLLAETGVTLVVGRIGDMGLRVALRKTEAILFRGVKRPRGPPLSHIAIQGVRVEVRPAMKYLGLTLDSRWSFVEHFRRMAPRVRAITAEVSRVMPNLGGPGDGPRRLYMGVAGSMLLYGAPVWARDLMASRSSTMLVNRLQRTLAIRSCRGYRTVSLAAAAVLSGAPPWTLLATAYADQYLRRARIRQERGGVPLSKREAEVLRLQSRERVVEEWQQELLNSDTSPRVTGAFGPVLPDWLRRRRSGLTFRLVQVLTGHGCFGAYLHRIGREPTTQCHHCSEREDTAQHTLEFCPAWWELRCVLTATVGGDLSLPALVRAMIGSDESYAAVVSFCEEVISQKETAERDRESQPDVDPARRRRGGRRRRQFDRLLA